jgi:hypothetical protein
LLVLSQSMPLHFCIEEGVLAIKPVLSTSRVGHGPRVISRDRPSSLRNAWSDHTDNICFISVFLKLEARFQIGVIRPIRVDHTDFFKWLLKLIHSW